MPKPRHRLGHISKTIPDDIIKEIDQMQSLKVRINNLADFFTECPVFNRDEDEAEFRSMTEYFNFIFVRFFDDIEPFYFVSQHNDFGELSSELNAIDVELIFIEDYVDLQENNIF